MSNDYFDPDISPSGVGKTASIKKSGAKRLNKMPILIMIGVVVILVAGLVYATIKRGEINEGEKVKITKVDQDGEKFASRMLEDLYMQFVRDKNTTPPKVNNPIKPIANNRMVVKEPNLGPGLSDKNIIDQIDKEALKLQQLKEKLYLSAITAPTQIKVNTSSIGGGGGAVANPLAALMQGAKAPGSGLDILKALASSRDKVEPNNETKNRPFLNHVESWDYLGSKKTKQVSPYEIKTGTFIPGVLLSGINSDLPGPIKGQVRENVYDTATGDHLLIPQGTTLVGRYSANVSFGQERAMVIWQRMVFPDGQTVNIGAMNGMDQEGYAGFSDQVDNHYFKIFGSAFLLTMLNGDMTVKDGNLVIKSQNTNTQRTETAMEKAAAGMIEKQLRVAPTIKIRPGFRFNIFVTQDMILEPLAYSVNGDMETAELVPSINRQSLTPGYADTNTYSSNIGMGKVVERGSTKGSSYLPLGTIGFR